MNYLKSFPALEGLADLANRDNIDISTTLLRVLTDLYVSKPKHSVEEERQYTELALRLLDSVDVSARRNVALKLASYEQAPAEVLRKLARDAIEVADPILRRSHCLTDDELMGIAGDFGSLQTQAADGSAGQHHPSGGSRSDPFAGSRAAGAELNEVFFAANAAERRLILLNLHYAPLVAARPLKPQEAIVAMYRLEAAALGHHVETFTQEIGQALAISPAQARRLVTDASGEPLVIAARALGMRAEILQRILLCLNPVIAQSVQQVSDLSDLFDQLKPEAALRMLAIWQTVDDKPKPAVHQPQYYDDERARRPGSGRTDARPLPAIRAGDRRLPRSAAPDPRASSKRNWR